VEVRVTSDRLRSTRKGAGLTLGQAARLLGLKVTTLSDVELGRVNPSDGWLQDMANLYHCSVAWLRGETAELSSSDEERLRDIEHTGARAVVREFMQMLSTRDPGTLEPPPAGDRLSAIASQMTPDLDDDDREDPGPHTHVPVGTWGSEGSWDECDICGERFNESRYHDDDQYDVDWDGREFDLGGEGGEA
jgi:transcriptional regulator with XRE-family HTH domain